jgi:hypothetical protein
MLQFTALERAVLEELCKQTAERAVLESQLATATVTGRKNTGEGFFTYFTVDRNCPPLTTRWSVVGGVFATIAGLERPLVLDLFRNKDGYAHMLEATSMAESTVGIDLSTGEFKINPREW